MWMPGVAEGEGSSLRRQKSYMDFLNWCSGGYLICHCLTAKLTSFLPAKGVSKYEDCEDYFCRLHTFVESARNMT